MTRSFVCFPTRAGAYKDRGGLLVRMRQFDRAIDDLDEAIRLDPKRASAYQNRGAAYNGLGRYEQAVEDLSKAIELDPDNAGAFTNRGLALFALGRYDQSLTDLTRRSSLRRETPIPYFNRAEVCARLGQRDQALEDYNEAIRLDPRMAAAYAASAGFETRTASAIGRFTITTWRSSSTPSRSACITTAATCGEKPATGEVRSPTTIRPWLSTRSGRRRTSRAAGRVSRRESMGPITTRGSTSRCKAGAIRFPPTWPCWPSWDRGKPGRPAEGETRAGRSPCEPSPRAWPVPVLRYMKGSLNEASLLETAVSKRQQTEAHAFIGLDPTAARRPQRGARAPALGQRKRLGRLDRRRRRQSGRSRESTGRSVRVVRPTLEIGAGPFMISCETCRPEAHCFSLSSVRRNQSAALTRSLIILNASCAAMRTPNSGSGGILPIALSVAVPPTYFRTSQAFRRRSSSRFLSSAIKGGSAIAPMPLSSLFDDMTIFLEPVNERLCCLDIIVFSQSIDDFPAQEHSRIGDHVDQFRHGLG